MAMLPTDRLTRPVARAAVTGASVLLGLSTFLMLWAMEPRSDPAAEDLLRQAAANRRALAYAGEVVGEQVVDGRTFAWQVELQHQPAGWTRVEFQEPQDQAGVILLMRGSEQFVFVPKWQKWHRGGGPDNSEHLDLLFQGYRCTLGDTETVAGRPARIILIEARTGQRPRETRWVCEDPPLVVKTERRDWRGERVRLMAFRSLEFGVELDDGLFVASTIAEDERDAAAPPDFEAVLPSWTPPGFRLISSVVSSRRGAPVSIAHYSDGLASLTLFVKRERDDRREHRDLMDNGKPEGSREGRTPSAKDAEGKPDGSRDGRKPPGRDLGGPAHGMSFVSWEDGGFVYVLTGEVPEAELQRVARSVPAVRLAGVAGSRAERPVR